MFEADGKNPPTKNDLEKIAVLTQLTYKQVNAWFQKVHARKNAQKKSSASINCQRKIEERS